MKWLALLAFAALLGAVSAGDDPTEKLPGVHDLDADTFDKVVNGAKHALVEFYAPWCGHCKRMTGEYKALGEAIQADPVLKQRVVIAKVNADSHRTVGERFGVRGFPTIKYFARGKPVTQEAAADYDRARSTDKFLEFLKEKLEADKGFARIEALDALAKKFVAEGADTAAILADTKAAVKKLEEAEQKNGKLYELFMERAIAKGKDYLAAEHARLNRVIESGSVAASKLDEMSAKVSVLSAFTGKEEAPAAEQKEEEEDDDDDVDEE